MIFYIVLVIHFIVLIALLFILFLQHNTKSELANSGALTIFKNRTSNMLVLRVTAILIFSFFTTSVFLLKTSGKDMENSIKKKENSELILKTEEYKQPKKRIMENIFSFFKKDKKE